MNKRIKKKQSTITKYRRVTMKKLDQLSRNRDDIFIYNDGNKTYDIVHMEEAIIPIEYNLSFEPTTNLKIVNHLYFVIRWHCGKNFQEITKHTSYFWIHPEKKEVVIQQGRHIMVIKYFEDVLPEIIIIHFPYNRFYDKNGIPLTLALKSVKVHDTYENQLDYLNKYVVI